MKNIGIWEEEYKIKTFNVDLNNKLTIWSLCGFFQQSATSHAAFFKAGYSNLIKENKVWMLSRLKLKIFKQPELDETIKINTWVNSFDRLFSYRDFHILDKNNEIISAARTAWIVYDINTKTVSNVEPFVNDYIKFIDKCIINDKTEKLKFKELKNENKSFPVRFSDIDINKHVNNIKYIQWIADSLSSEMMLGKNIGLFEMNYISQAHFGDEIIISYEKISEKPLIYYQIIKRKFDNKELCKAKIVFTK